MLTKLPCVLFLMIFWANGTTEPYHWLHLFEVTYFFAIPYQVKQVLKAIERLEAQENVEE